MGAQGILLGLAVVAAIAIGIVAKGGGGRGDPPARADDRGLPGDTVRLAAGVGDPARGDDATILRLADAVRTGPWSAIKSLLDEADELEMDAITDLARTKLLRMWVEGRCRVATGRMIGLLLRLGTHESALVEAGLTMLGDEASVFDGIELVALLAAGDGRIEAELGRLLLQGLAEEGDHPSQLTLAVERALFRRGRAHPSVIDALARDLDRHARAILFQIAARIGSDALALEPKLREFAERAELDGDMRAHALRALTSVAGVQGAGSTLRSALDSGSPLLRLTALRACESASAAPTELLQPMVERLRDEDGTVRLAAFQTLARWATRDGVDLALAERMQRRTEAYQESREFDDALLLREYCEVLGDHPSSSAVLLERLVVLSGGGFESGIRWRAVFAVWRARGNTLDAARRLTAILTNAMFMDQPKIVSRLARMAYVERVDGDAAHPDAELLRRIISNTPAALTIVRALADQPGPIGEDARRLLPGYPSVPPEDR